MIIDNVGNRSLLECRRVLKPNGRYVLIGGGGVNDGRWVGPLANPIRALLLAPFVTQKMGMMMAVIDKKDLASWPISCRAGKVKPVIDRTYPLSQAADAMRYLEKGHAQGKVIITMADTNEASPADPNPPRVLPIRPSGSHCFCAHRHRYWRDDRADCSRDHSQSSFPAA